MKVGMAVPQASPASKACFNFPVRPRIDNFPNYLSPSNYFVYLSCHILADISIFTQYRVCFYKISDLSLDSTGNSISIPFRLDKVSVLVG